MSDTDEKQNPQSLIAAESFIYYATEVKNYIFKYSLIFKDFVYYLSFILPLIMVQIHILSVFLQSLETLFCLMPSEFARMKLISLLIDFKQSFLLDNYRIHAVVLLVQKDQPAYQTLLSTTVSGVFVHVDLQEKHVR